MGLLENTNTEQPDSSVYSTLPPIETLRYWQKPPPTLAWTWPTDGWWWSCLAWRNSFLGCGWETAVSAASDMSQCHRCQSFYFISHDLALCHTQSKWVFSMYWRLPTLICPGSATMQKWNLQSNHRADLLWRMNCLKFPVTLCPNDKCLFWSETFSSIINSCLNNLLLSFY